MSSESEALEKLKIFISLHQNEVNIHWTRNNYFLLTSSILLVALTQLKEPLLQFMIGAVGASLNLIWLFIQMRSNRYVSYWNKTMYSMGDSAGLPKFYPATERKIPAIRTLTLALPLPFLILWIAVMIAIVAGVTINGPSLSA